MSYVPQEIYVLIVVNTQETLKTGNLGSNVYMVDSQGSTKDPGQGGNELNINCHPQDQIFFRVTGILEDSNPRLTQFRRTGGEDIYDPAFVNNYWQGTVTGTGKETYHWVVTIQGKNFEWDPFITSTNP